ncbi:MAG: hypothetical protein AB1861_02620 [Cyanobacteriota bacterium]
MQLGDNICGITNKTALPRLQVDVGAGLVWLPTKRYVALPIKPALSRLEAGLLGYHRGRASEQAFLAIT